MRKDYDLLKTEQINQSTKDIDKLSTLDMLRAINDEDKKVAQAVEAELPNIARAVDIIADAISHGGHLIYIGAGTSGRLGVVDASECPPTYGVDPTLVRGIIAGGKGAMFRSSEGMEDREELGAEDIDSDGVTSGDVVVAISASGGAPYCIGALKRARELGASTVALSCNPSAVMNSFADVAINPYVGPEVIQGSTRMKAGTAQKLVLNMLSTGAMVKTGKVYGNLMINVAPTNDKLRRRAIGIIVQIAGCPAETAAELLDEYGSIRAALDQLGIK